MADQRTLDIILNPHKEHPDLLWGELGFGGPPSTGQLRSEIEEKVLVPKKGLLAQSLNQYQM